LAIDRCPELKAKYRWCFISGYEDENEAPAPVDEYVDPKYLACFKTTAYHPTPL
jgi:hypothetical protein